MQTSYRFVNTGIQDAALNMALDEAILLHHIRGDVPPTLRVFRWFQPSISLGRFQNIEREIESERCQQQSVALVRRPTGGRAVYHRDEFTYSIVIGKREGVPSGVVAAYAYLGCLGGRRRRAGTGVWLSMAEVAGICGRRTKRAVSPAIYRSNSSATPCH